MRLAAARLCAASRARRTWLSLVALTLLVGFVGAVVLTAARARAGPTARSIA